MGRGSDGRIVRVEGQLDVVRCSADVVDIRTEEDRGDQSTLPNPARKPRRDDVAVWKHASNVRPRS